MRAIILLLLCSNLYATDWSRNAKLPGAVDGFSPNSRTNIFNLRSDYQVTVENGYKHVMVYPVAVTELIIPFYPLKNFFETDPKNPIRRLIFRTGRRVSPFKSMEDLFSWLGLNDFPDNDSQMGPTPVPPMSGDITKYPMGTTLMEKDGATGMTFSCAACHTNSLFGKKIVGLTNRFPRANEFFRRGKQIAPLVNPHVFRGALGTTKAEFEMFKSAKNVLKWVGVKKPQAVGLDTSLAQVGISLSKRGLDEYAQRSLFWANFPRPNKLETVVADSKPAVWWNVKYKTRWLSDGSIVSGNPIHTNFLWNEIGRGVDLKKLEKWLVDNKDKIKELTAAVFATKAPHYTDFFRADEINLESAKRGEKIFKASCQKCHGKYEKNWSLSSADNMSDIELLKTNRVFYHEQTPVKHVGTDQKRFEGMNYFYKDLNRLKISKTIGTVVEPQKGYVPPPLVGIWARWPYFHNNSIPNLCALLTPPSERPKIFWMGEANDPNTDFDSECNGYPLGDKVPENWKKDKEYLFDTSKEGLSNSGHYKMLLNEDGSEKYTIDQKLDLIEFLKTL